MPEREWRFRIHDIVEAIDKIAQYTARDDSFNWLEDSKTVDAVIRNLEIIGEAALRIPVEIQDEHRSIPWHLMKGMRNMLAHEYFGIDLDIIQRTVDEDLPDLRSAIMKILDRAS